MYIYSDQVFLNFNLQETDFIENSIVIIMRYYYVSKFYFRFVIFVYYSV